MPAKGKSGTYHNCGARIITCAGCGLTFHTVNTAEEDRDEMLMMWGDLPLEGQRFVCDSCYQRVLARMPKA